ncbi:MAG: hypothetical protein QF684_03540 [Candidatus Thalassarchaeaceae archaeon]|nr:hypothetical protein [Candidatus Thalassarchaeaceae archaeon]
MVTKKSEAWMVIITASSNDPVSLAASLACEDFECVVDELETVHVTIHGDSASDLRAKYNSAMRSLRASSEALSVIE